MLKNKLNCEIHHQEQRNVTTCQDLPAKRETQTKPKCDKIVSLRKIVGTRKVCTSGDPTVALRVHFSM